MVIRDQEAKAVDILQWVSDASVRDAHIFVREKKLGRRYWNTGQWLINLPEFSQWKDSSSGIFRLEGGVGVGKSCLVSMVVTKNFSKQQICV